MSFGPTNDNMIGWVLDPRRFSFYIYFCFIFCFTTCNKIYKYLHIKIKNVRNKKKLPEYPCIGKRLKYPRISQEFMKMPLAAVWLTRGYCWHWQNFPASFLGNERSLLLDLRSRILIVVVSTAVDVWRERIENLKLRWPARFAVFFRPDEAAKTLHKAGFMLCRRFKTFLWWLWGLRRPDMGDRRRERESRRWEERDALRFCYGVNGCTVHQCSWRQWAVG